MAPIDESRVKILERSILIEGKPVRITSGAIHCFRVPGEYWRDRPEKAVQTGLNRVETYMPRNLHGRKEGRYDFPGMPDFEKFVRTAREAGLHVILRPGPCVCAERDNGGLPCRPVTKEGARFRRMNKPHVEALGRYFARIPPGIKALQYDDGGRGRS